MLKPICFKCHVFYRMKKSGLYITEGMPTDNLAPKGLIKPELWKPYKIWAIDMRECVNCRHQILIGSGREPISEHYRDDFAGLQHKLGADLYQVNDC